MLQVRSPYNQRLIKEIPLQGKAEAETALAIAYNLFNDTSLWLPAWQRIEILEKTITIMNTRVNELTNMAAEEGGKPYTDSEVEVERAIMGVKLAADYISRLNGEQVPMGVNKASENRIAFTTREPIGVV
ncbi:MAG: aldehyde dehydrogenase family protein, partial [Ferruginibacter sp.]